jgi:energy-coupling factor transport system permease protein
MDADTFSSYHPLVNFAYFGVVVGVTILMPHPVLLAVSFGAAMCYSIWLNGRKAVRFNLLFVLPVMVPAALVNPLFSHGGVTILEYFPDGNPLTLESIVYGVVTAVMVGSVIMWFSCYHAVMTSDKFVYLFGRVIPALSLVFSMALRLVPRYKTQIRRISAAQRGVGVLGGGARGVGFGSVSGRPRGDGLSDGVDGDGSGSAVRRGSRRRVGLLRRVRSGLSILSAMVSWALENAIDSADSMKSRGYGLPGRTAYSDYRWEFRDRLALATVALASGIVFAAVAARVVHIKYFASIVVNPAEPVAFGCYAAFAVLCLLPLLLDLREEFQWRFSLSKI